MDRDSNRARPHHLTGCKGLFLYAYHSLPDSTLAYIHVFLVVCRRVVEELQGGVVRAWRIRAEGPGRETCLVASLALVLIYRVVLQV